MPDITITITDAEMKALEYVVVDPVEWCTNFTKNRAAAAMQEIYENEIERMLADKNIDTIPANKEAIVAAAEIKSAAERQAEFLANPPEVYVPNDNG
jgi:hypothetical protein